MKDVRCKTKKGGEKTMHDLTTLRKDFPRKREIVQRFCQEQGTNEDKAGLYCKETLKFLNLSAISKVPYVPSVQVDLFWHTMLMYTLAYQNLCEERFGKVIHHNPTEGKDVEGYDRTRDLMRAVYGNIDLQFWPENHANTADCGESPETSCSALKAENHVIAGCGESPDNGPGDCVAIRAKNTVIADCDSGGTPGDNYCSDQDDHSDDGN